MPRRRALLLSPLAAFCALVLTMVLPQSAQAFTESGYVTVASNANYCVKANAYIEQLVPGVFSGDDASSSAVAYAGNCTTPIAVQARTRLDLQYWDDWDPNNSYWRTCISTAWVYGTTGNSQWGPTGPQSNQTYYGPTCGVGYYRTRAYADIQLISITGGAFWFGGHTDSGYVWADQ